MTIRSTGQNWALDIALAQGGFDALHPQAKGTMEQLGHDHTDFDKVFALVRSGAMLPEGVGDDRRSGAGAGDAPRGARVRAHCF